MSTVTFSRSRRETMECWRRQIGHRHRLAVERGPRPFAVISYLVRDPRAELHRVDLRRLLLIALFDERLTTGELATRVIGIAGALGPDGLRFGGPDLSRFEKDLRLAPTVGGRGPRFDAADGELLQLALSLERYLERCARHPYFPRRLTPRLPVLATGPGGSGCVDLTSLSKRQVIAFDSPERDHCGCCGTTAFDFYHTRFRRAP